MSTLPDRSYDKVMRQTDWFRRHVHREQDYLALARRLSGSLEAAQEIYCAAMRQIIRDGNWHRIINPDAYLMRLKVPQASDRPCKILPRPFYW